MTITAGLTKSEYIPSAFIALPLCFYIDLDYFDLNLNVTRRSIQRDVLPGITMAVKREYSIEITDLTGKSWRPRVQKDRLGLAHKRG